MKLLAQAILRGREPLPLELSSRRAMAHWDLQMDKYTKGSVLQPSGARPVTASHLIHVIQCATQVLFFSECCDLNQHCASSPL